jgi:acetyl-CoA carboxylase alpha subunit
VSPEGCATILYKDAERAEDVAGCLKMNAHDLLAMGIADEVVAEPPGGAQRDPDLVYAGVAESLGRALAELCSREPAELVASRYGRLRAFGVFEEPGQE